MHDGKEIGRGLSEIRIDALPKVRHGQVKSRRAFKKQVAEGDACGLSQLLRLAQSGPTVPGEPRFPLWVPVDEVVGVLPGAVHQPQEHLRRDVHARCIRHGYLSLQLRIRDIGIVVWFVGTPPAK